MTLEQAYEQLKKELHALRRENARLKAGTYVDSEKAAHEKEIRRLTNENNRLLKERDKYHDLWRKALQQAGSSLDDLIKIDDLTVALDAALSENNTLTEQLDDANNTIKKLKSQMNRDHSNSSIPSSKERFPKKIKNSRVKTDKKRGAQPGHHGHKRPFMEPTAVIKLPVPTEILNNPNYYPTGKIIKKQLADIHISVSVTQYEAEEYRSRTTGKRVHAPFPDGIVNEFNYGSNAKALALMLNNYCNVSIEKTSELISGISNNAISLSTGLINDLCRQFSVKTRDDRQRIYDRLLLAPVMYSDATPGRVNGKTVQIIICANDDELLYSFREHKGFEGIKGTPVEEYQQILVHDHDKTYYNYGGEHQECLAHVLRYLQDGIENETELTWHTQMKALLSEAIHHSKHNSYPLDEQTVNDFHERYDSILKLGDEEYTLHPPNKYYPDGLNLLKRLCDYKNEHLLFLSNSDVNYTNNLSERALRKFKRKQRQAVTFRCNNSIEYLCDCLSIIETNRIYQSNVFEIIREAFT